MTGNKANTPNKKSHDVLDAELKIDGIYQEFYPYLCGSLQLYLQSVSHSRPNRRSIGDIAFKLYHTKNYTNGVKDISYASEYIGDKNTSTLEDFLTYIEKYDTAGLSDITASVVVIEQITVRGATEQNDVYSQSMRNFLDNMAFLNVDFIIVEITDSSWGGSPFYATLPRIYKSLGFEAMDNSDTKFVFNGVFELLRGEGNC